MKKNGKKVMNRVRYDEEFKKQAVALAAELESVSLAAEKLGMSNTQSLGAWVRHHKKINSNDAYKEALTLKEENKQLRKELDREKKITAILRDATVFFCQNQPK